MRIKWILILGVLLFIFCGKKKEVPQIIGKPGFDFEKFIQENQLEDVSYVFAVHLTGSECLGCIMPVKNLNSMYQKVKERQIRLAMFVIGDSSSKKLLSFCSSMGFQFPVLDESKLRDLNLPDFPITPFCYLIDLRNKRIVYKDFVQENETAFKAVINMVEKMNGIYY